MNKKRGKRAKKGVKKVAEIGKKDVKRRRKMAKAEIIQLREGYKILPKL